MAVDGLYSILVWLWMVCTVYWCGSGWSVQYTGVAVDGLYSILVWQWMVCTVYWCGSGWSVQYTGVAVDIRTLHDCLSQMNENLLISNSKLTSDSELIW